MYDKGKEKFPGKQANQYDDQCIATMSCRAIVRTKIRSKN
jgi:hypothetical protein